MRSTASAGTKADGKSFPPKMTTDQSINRRWKPAGQKNAPSKPSRRAAGPRVSVVIPAYNAQETLERAIRTVLDQTVAPFEVIVVDDASTDGTRELVQALAAQDPRLRLIASSPNAGPAHCRNIGFRAAEGDWIAIQD